MSLIDLDIEVMQTELRKVNYELDNNTIKILGKHRYNYLMQRKGYLTGYLDCYNKYVDGY